MAKPKEPLCLPLPLPEQGSQLFAGLWNNVLLGKERVVKCLSLHPSTRRWRKFNGEPALAFITIYQCTRYAKEEGLEAIITVPDSGTIMVEATDKATQLGCNTMAITYVPAVDG